MILSHILRYCGEIKQITERFGDSIDAFRNDFAYRHACTMCILQIGELSARLTDDFKQVYDGMPWKNIKAMRNIFVHDYNNLNIDTTWDTIKENIPMLSAYCSDILNQYKVLEQPALEIDYAKKDEDDLEL